MKLEHFIKDMQEFDDGWGVQQYFDKEHDGCCPCFEGEKEIDGVTVKVRGRCWRVSDHDQDLHISGKASIKFLKVIGKLIKKPLDNQRWYNKYTLIIHKLK